MEQFVPEMSFFHKMLLELVDGYSEISGSLLFCSLIGWKLLFLMSCRGIVVINTFAGPLVKVPTGLPFPSEPDGLRQFLLSKLTFAAATALPINDQLVLWVESYFNDIALR
jgi:hypothetical protein